MCLFIIPRRRCCCCCRYICLITADRSSGDLSFPVVEVSPDLRLWEYFPFLSLFLSLALLTRWTLHHHPSTTTTTTTISALVIFPPSSSSSSSSSSPPPFLQYCSPITFLSWSNCWLSALLFLMPPGVLRLCAVQKNTSLDLFERRRRKRRRWLPVSVPSTVCWHCQDCLAGWLIQQKQQQWLRQLTDIEKSTILDGFEMLLLLLMVMVVFEVVVVVDDTDYCMCIVGKIKRKKKKRKKKRTGNRTAKQVSVAVFAGSIAAQFNRFDTLHLLRLLLLLQTMVVVVVVRQWCHWCWTSISSFLLLRVWLYSNGFIWIALSSTDLLPTISICCQLVRVQFSARFSVSKRSLIESAGVGSS